MALFKLLVKRLFLTLLIFPLIVLPAIYITLRTEQGALWLSQILSKNNYYQINIGRIHHSLTMPFRFELQNLRIERDGKPLMEINTVVGILNQNIIHEPNLLDYLSLENGKIDLSDTNVQQLPLDSNWLLLKNVDLYLTTPYGELILNNVAAGVAPWNPNEFMTQESEFRFSAARFRLNDLKGEHLLTHGRIQKNNLAFYTIGANFGQGEATGQMTRDANGKWTINQLYLNHFNWLSSQTLTEFYKNLARLPPLTIRHLDIIDTHLEGDAWALNNANLSLTQLELENGEWTVENGSANFSAGDVVFHDMHFSDPIVKLLFNDGNIAIQQINGRWQGGLIRAEGLWHANQLDFNELTVSAVEYALPENWQAIADYEFPDWLQTLDVNNLKVMRSVIVDPEPTFPFQITLLEIDGQKLRLIDNHHIGLWRGQLSAHANNATFNKVDLRYPVVSLVADNEHIQFTKMSAFTDNGLIDSQLTVNQNDRNKLSLNLTGHNVSLDLLNNWGWQDQAVAGSGNIEFQLSKEGREHLINATLAMTNQEGQRIIQRIPKTQDSTAERANPVSEPIHEPDSGD